MKSRSQPPGPTPAPFEPAPDLTGKKIGDFRILRLLGQGGMGVVYLAEQISLQRKVALKMLREDVAAKPVSRERFQAESKTVAQLNHPNIVQVYMVGEYKGRHYMVLEYVKGKSLRDYLVGKGPLDVPLVLSLMRQVAAALTRASELGIVHRDIKPENILLTRKGEAKVADFGLSLCLNDEPLALTRAGSAVGTPMFMSPEQVEGKVVDARSDIYSFGVTCYQMLSGQTPFEGSNAYQIALKHVREDPLALEVIRPDIPAALCALVRKMMAKKPNARYQSARDLLKDIARLRESLTVTTGCVPVECVAAETIGDEDSEDSLPVPTRKRKRPGRSAGNLGWVLALAALVILAGLGVGGVIVWQRWSARPEAGLTTAPSAGVVPASPGTTEIGRPEQEEALKKAVEQHLKDTSPNPAGVQACIDLGVLYLEQNKASEAEALFKRMDERRAPSAYHYLGRLGLAVTDALKNNSRASHSKFAELFDPKSKDNRAQVINTYLTKNPEFAKWVNEADSHNVRNGSTGVSIPQGLRGGRFNGKSPFRKP